MIRCRNGTLCTPDGLVRGEDLCVADGRLRFGPAPVPDETVIDLAGAFVLPGFVETHTHGAGLFEFTAGRFDPATGAFIRNADVYAAELPRYAALRARTGVTNIYLGTWAAPAEQLRFCFAQLRDYMASPGNGRDGALIRGGLLEGTFLNPAMAGAQDPAYVLEQSVETFDRINESGVIRLVNVVPDYGEASCRLTEHLAREGIAVGAGHTSATCEQFRRAAACGLKYCIHFLNGPTGGSYKLFDGGGAVEAVLQLDDVWAEQIVDGFHVSPAYVREVIARKGVERVIAVSDAMFASQAEGVTDFQIGNIPGRLSDDGRYVYVRDAGTKTLFSSVLTMDVAFGNVLSYLTREVPGTWRRMHPALPFDEAISAAARLCATNACEMLAARGGADTETGSLREGLWADLVVADIDGEPGQYDVKVRRVFVRGREVAV